MSEWSTMQRRAAIIVRRLDVAGAERQAVHLARGLQRRHDWTVALWSFFEGAQVRDHLGEATPVTVLSPTSHRIGHRLLWFAALVLSFRAFKPDVLIPMTDYPNKVVGALSPLLGARVCLWNQRDEGREVTGRPMERLALRWVDHFVANSPSGAEHLMSRFGVSEHRISLIPNGVDLEPAADDRVIWRRRLAIADERPVAVMCANLHRFKDHETLLHAWADLCRRLPVAPILLLAGRDGDRRAAIDSLISDLGLGEMVRILGFVDDVSGLLGACDLSVFSSQREGSPNAVLEAMAAGLPVVATDIPGIRMVLGDGHPGLVPPRDAASLAERVVTMLRDDELRRTLRRDGLERVRTTFTVDAMVDRYVDLVARLDGSTTIMDR
jgi:glycosyltransferase involved in cell wall biosynthesis